MLGSSSIVPEVGQELLCLPQPSLNLLGGLSIAQPAVECQQPGVSPLAVAGRPSDLWEDYNYKSSPRIVLWGGAGDPSRALNHAPHCPCSVRELVPKPYNSDQKDTCLTPMFGWS